MLPLAREHVAKRVISLDIVRAQGGGKPVSLSSLDAPALGRFHLRYIPAVMRDQLQDYDQASVLNLSLLPAMIVSDLSSLTTRHQTSADYMLMAYLPAMRGPRRTTNRDRASANHPPCHDHESILDLSNVPEVQVTVGVKWLKTQSGGIMPACLIQPTQLEQAAAQVVVVGRGGGRKVRSCLIVRQRC